MKHQIGRYKIRQELGRGGMAIVYRAYDPLFERMVAVKVLSSRLMNNPAFRARFKAEAKIISNLEHPAIVPVHDFGEEENQLYIVMRYMTGGSLKDRLKNGPMPLTEVRDILIRLAGALEKLHENNMIHRDIKPANVLFDDQNEPYLADFGIARKIVPGTVTFAGTLQYMAPEQQKGENLDERTDIYSLAVMTFKMITGEFPALGISVLHHPALPSGSDQVLARALAYAKEERYSRAGQFATAFAAAIEPKGIWDQLWQVLKSWFDPPPSTRAEPAISYPPPIRVSSVSSVSLPSKDMRVGKSTYDDEVSRSKESDDRRIFICYQHGISEDQKLTDYLFHFMSDQGYRVFVESSRVANPQWINQIEQQLEKSDLLVVLLSQQSAHSQKIHSNLQRAYEYGKLGVGPRILAVRMAYRGHSAIDQFLDPRQYVLWQSVADNEQVGRQVLASMQGNLAPQAPIEARSFLIQEPNYPPPPQPAEASDLLKELATPGGVVSGKFYISRETDTLLKREVIKTGGILSTIRAPRQTGKTSLLVQGLHYARDHGIKVVNIDLQRVDRTYLKTSDDFLRYLAEHIVWELELDLDQVEQAWRGPLGPQDKVTRLLERYVLTQYKQPILLAMDEVDRLLETNFHTDFFALVRSWHNSRAFYDEWKKFNIVLVISTEPHLLIADVNQSPFNVGLRLHLEDFSQDQVRDLNQRHGSPLQESEISQLMDLLSGHPYLTRQALYALVTQSLNWRELKQIALTERGPFSEHLRRYYKLLHNQHDLRAALKQVIKQNRCLDEMTLYRLLRAGLVKGNSASCRCRCNLYHMYFENKL